MGKQMGIADRDYQRNQRTDGGSEFFNRLTPVVKALLILNLGIYFLDFAMEARYGERVFRNFGVFTIHSAFIEHRYWEFITFQFLHATLGHVLFNCIGLFFFGPWMERWWGAARFLVFYLLCGTAGALFFTVLVKTGVLPAVDADAALLGASAGIYGILVGVAVVAPDLRVSLLFPPIEVSMRQMAIALMVIAIGSILLTLGGNEGGEAGHLGGAILGYVLARNPRLLGRGNIVSFQRPTSPRPSRPAKLRPRVNLDLQRDSAVDAILDKISREGIHSLTPEEREFLQKSSSPPKS